MMHVIKAAVAGAVEDRMVGYKCWLSGRSVPSVVFVLLTWYRWYNSFWSDTGPTAELPMAFIIQPWITIMKTKVIFLWEAQYPHWRMARSQELRPWFSVPCEGCQSDRQGWSWLCRTVTRRTIQMCCLFLFEQFLVPIKRDCHYFCGTSFGAERGGSSGD